MMHVDEEGLSPDLPLGDHLLAFRVQAMPGGFIRFSYRTATGDEDRQVIDVSEVLEKTMSTSESIDGAHRSSALVHKYGVYRFRTSTSSAPSTPNSSHRLRPSMLNLDTLSRNLFGTGSVSSRGTDNSSTLSSKRSKSIDSRLSGDSKRSSDFALSPGPYRMPEDKSEVDLNERLNLARKNSNIAAWSPAKPPKSPLNVTLPSHVSMPVPPSVTRSEPGLATNGHSNSNSAQVTPVATRKKDYEDREADLRAASGSSRSIRGCIPQADRSVRSGSPTPMSPSAPLRVRNRSPSPIRADGPTSPRLNGPRSPIGPRSPLPMTARSPSPTRPVTTQPLSIPGRTLPMPARAQTTDGLSSSAPITPAKYGGLGSGHTRLRLVSGGGRKVSPGRETVPLRDEASSQVRRVSAKRQHSEDHLQPRKRSDSRTPLNPIDTQQQTMPGLSPSSSLNKKDVTPRKGSNGTATPVRRSSVVTLDSEVAEYSDTATALDAAKQRVREQLSFPQLRELMKQIMEARVTSKRIKTELSAMRKQNLRGSLTRSPQRRNITVSHPG